MAIGLPDEILDHGRGRATGRSEWTTETPWPLASTAIMTSFAAVIPSSALEQLCSDTAVPVSKVSVPPSGIASRAMTARLRTAVMSRLGIDQGKRGFGGPPRIDLDVFAERGPQQTGRIDKQRIDVDGARLRWLAAREREQIRGQAGATGGGLGDQPCDGCKVRAIRDSLLQDFDRAG